jgi:hypothetical protein
MIDTLTPFGVGSEYSWIRSGCWAGHFLVIWKELRSVIVVALRVGLVFNNTKDQASSLAGH